MSTESMRRRIVPGAIAIGIAVLTIGLAGCEAEVSGVNLAESRVAANEDALAEAQAQFADASANFCAASKTYVMALDRYGDVLNDTAPTVGDVRDAGADLAEPKDEAFEGAEAAVEAQQQVAIAEDELAQARAELERVKASPSGEPSPSDSSPATPAPLAPALSVERVMQAESEFADAQGAITDDTPLADAAEQFNSAAVALEFAWLRLFVDAGCISDEQAVNAQAAASAYTTALQQDLAETGYYAGAVDGVYGPETVGAVESLQEANGLPITGTMDAATSAALQAELLALGGAAAQESIATTAAVQQTLKLVGFWDGPVDGVWTPALTEAVKAFQIELGVEPTGAVDAATVSAFQQALADFAEAEPTESPAPSPSSTPES
ncbi:peptidoglycan-binding protein [Microbacterium sp. NPDC056736]|uniref:peptidoglycan-binding domain-containing protein n=1 Tax=Microbacterium sp. NPDC056736 TaxID=3345932 RepID=UPI0036703B84